MSMDSLISYQYQLSIGGEVVDEREWQQLVEAGYHWSSSEASGCSLTARRCSRCFSSGRAGSARARLELLDVLRMDAETAEDLEWDHDEAVEAMLARLQDKSAFAPVQDPASLQGTLRDYQRRGVAWLQYLEALGLNPCLADDMGLGKTVQVITAADGARPGQPPAAHAHHRADLGSGQLAQEIERFAPQLRTMVHQGADRIRMKSASRPPAPSMMWS